MLYRAEEHALLKDIYTQIEDHVTATADSAFEGDEPEVWIGVMRRAVRNDFCAVQCTHSSATILALCFMCEVSFF